MKPFAGTLFDIDGPLRVHGNFMALTAPQAGFFGTFLVPGGTGMKLATRAGSLVLEIDGGPKLNVNLKTVSGGPGGTAAIEFVSNGPPL